MILQVPPPNPWFGKHQLEIGVPSSHKWRQGSPCGSLVFQSPSSPCFLGIGINQSKKGFGRITADNINWGAKKISHPQIVHPKCWSYSFRAIPISQKEMGGPHGAIFGPKLRHHTTKMKSYHLNLLVQQKQLDTPALPISHNLNMTLIPLTQKKKQNTPNLRLKINLKKKTSPWKKNGTSTVGVPYMVPLRWVSLLHHALGFFSDGTPTWRCWYLVNFSPALPHKSSKNRCWSLIQLPAPMAIESDPDGWTNEVDPQKRDIRPCFKEMIYLPTINLLGENPLVFMGVITSTRVYNLFL